MAGWAKNALRFAVVYGVGGVISWVAVEAIRAGIADPALRDWAIAVIVPLALILMTVSFCVWVWRGDQPKQTALPRGDDAHRRALHTAMTWLYRRDGGYAQPYDGPVREFIPWKEYVRKRYDALDLEAERIEPWLISATPEPDREDSPT